MIKLHLLGNALIHTDCCTHFPEHANVNQLPPPLKQLASPSKDNPVYFYIFIYFRMDFGKERNETLIGNLFQLCIILLSFISQYAPWIQCSRTSCIQLVSLVKGAMKTESFSSWEKKLRVTNYSRHNMSCDCIITLWTIDVAVTVEIAISAPSVMDFSLIAEHDDGPFLFDSQGLKTSTLDLTMII